MSLKYFGTDGIRGRNEFFTDGLLEAVGYAAAKLCKGNKILIARDTRESGEEIMSKLAKTLAENGADVIVAGMTPTPVVSFLTVKYGCYFGVMISASHNPPEYNGIKFFAANGGKINEKTEEEIESIIDGDREPSNLKSGGITVISGDGEYIDWLSGLFDARLVGVKIMLDTANGATAKIAPALFKAFGADVYVVNDETDGKRINENCGATCVETLRNGMKGGYDIGFSYDGDGDRVMAVKNGRVIDGDHIMYIAARYFKEKGLLDKPVIVGTVMTNLGMEAAAGRHGISLVRTAVGDKYVSREMEAGGYIVGGEESGHVIFGLYAKTGDGLLSSLILAIIDKEMNADALDDIIDYPRAAADIKTTPEKVKAFRESQAIKEYIDAVSKKINGRVVVRASGTEPKIRIMAETESKEESEKYAGEIRKFIMESI